MNIPTLTSFKKVTSLFSNTTFLFWALSALFFIFNFPSISAYWHLPIVGGWDGAGHAAVGQYYAEHIFPKTWGWVPYWLGGMPFPQFYPPLFFFLTALLSKILFFISYTGVFQLFVIFLQTILPGVLGWVTKGITKSSLAAWVTGIVSIVIASSPHLNMAGYGISTTATFNTGFVAQLLGFILFLCWIHYFLKIEENIIARYMSVVCLSGVFLSNAHIIPVAVLYFAATFIVKIRTHTYPFNVKKFTRYSSLYFILGIAPLALTAFWTLPLLKEYTYLLTSPIFLDTLSVIKNSGYFLLGMLLATIFSIRTKNNNILTIVLVNIFIALTSVVRLDQHFSYLPLHSARWLAEFFFLDTILIGYAVSEAVKLTQEKYKKKILIAVGIIAVCIIWNMHPFDINRDGMVREIGDPKTQELLAYMKGKPGRVLVENYLSSEPLSMALDALIGPSGDGAGTFILRESSISDLFMVPIRNSISQSDESWGVTSLKATDKAFFNAPLDESIQRAATVGTRYFLIRTLFMDSKFEKSNLVTLEKDFGDWKLFTLKNPTQYGQVLSYEPVLLYSHLNFKDRLINDYDYSRFQEELSSNVAASHDITLVSPHDLSLDTSSDLGRFKTTVVSDYTYRDINVAYQKLEAYSRDHNLMIVFDRDPLFDKLSLLDTKTHHIFIAPRNIDRQGGNSIDSKTNFKALFITLDGIKIPITTDASVQNTTITNSSINVELHNPNGTEVPVLIKETYFPTWKNTDTTDVYLATPTFMLTFAKNDFQLNFETDSSVHIGEVISLITLLAGIVGIGFVLRNKKVKT